ncbi:MAG: CcoQ/FixQ family Cbb3-type cytochrome c oxidase assembly chaperone [bacterium]|nr:CcoQ/FixQ family Cbb3-type cytochrome c oxidase assembly chaperone [bacterium]
MKFINYLESISGVEIYPLVSLLIFFLFFIAVGVYLLKSGKDHFNDVSKIPLDNNEN